MGLDSNICFFSKLSKDQVARLEGANISEIYTRDINWYDFTDKSIVKLVPIDIRNKCTKIEVLETNIDWDMIEEELGVVGQQLYGIHGDSGLSYGVDYEHQKRYAINAFDSKYKKVFKKTYWFCYKLEVYEFMRGELQDKFFKYMCSVKRPLDRKDEKNRIINCRWYDFAKEDYDVLCEMSPEFKENFKENIVGLYYQADW